MKLSEISVGSQRQSSKEFYGVLQWPKRPGARTC